MHKWCACDLYNADSENRTKSRTKGGTKSGTKSRTEIESRTQSRTKSALKQKRCVSLTGLDTFSYEVVETILVNPYF